MNKDLQMMQLALELAEQGRNTVSPNPMVGCVIVKNEQIIASGFHQYAGGPHAEVYALQQAGEAARGATMYLTLEPCCHLNKKTPPCVPALIQAGIEKVYAACLDPNPAVAGKGIEALRAAGIAVEVGLCDEAARKQNEVFFYYMQHKRPFVLAKWAMSLDGKTVVQQADNRQISGQDAHQHTHLLRQQVDAILIGANTACRDNPLLTARPLNQQSKKQPMRVILTGQKALPRDLNLFKKTSTSPTLIISTNKNHLDYYQPLLSAQIELLLLQNDHDAHVPLKALLAALGKRGITSVLVEGGMKMHESFFNENLVNKVHVYLSPTIIGTRQHKHYLQTMHADKLGEDVFITATY